MSLAAVVSRLSGRSPSPRIYGINKVPALPEYPYSVASVVRVDVGGYTLSEHGTRGWRIVVSSFGRTVESAQAYDDAAFDLLQDYQLSSASTPCQLELASRITRDPDDGSIVGILSTFTYVTS